MDKHNKLLMIQGAKALLRMNCLDRYYCTGIKSPPIDIRTCWRCGALWEMIQIHPDIVEAANSLHPEEYCKGE